jgi:hypothetical protein
VRIPLEPSPPPRSELFQWTHAISSISYQDYSAFLEQHLGHIRLSACRTSMAAFIRAPDSNEWTNFTESMDMSWVNEVLEVFKYYTERTTNSHIEVKKSSITAQRTQSARVGVRAPLGPLLSVTLLSCAKLVDNSSAGSVRICSRTTCRGAQTADRKYCRPLLSLDAPVLCVC